MDTRTYLYRTRGATRGTIDRPAVLRFRIKEGTLVVSAFCVRGRHYVV